MKVYVFKHSTQNVCSGVPAYIALFTSAGKSVSGSNMLPKHSDFLTITTGILKVEAVGKKRWVFWATSNLLGVVGWGFPGGSDGKESACHAGDLSLIPGSGRSPGGGNGNPLQYSCLVNPLDRRAWRATVHRLAKSWTLLSMSHHHSP